MNYKNIINPQFKHLTKFIKNIPQKFDEEGILIHDSRNVVRVFKIDGEPIVVKRFHRSKLHQRFDYTFMRPSKAKCAYNYALQFLEKGISTPEPIACIEEYHFGIFRRCFLVTTYCGDPDARVLRDEWEEHDDLIDALARFLVKIHEAGFLHGDTNLSNFFYRKDPSSPGGYHITTIDINRSEFVENPSQEMCIKNLRRLTHVRPALKKILSKYAKLRGWDVEKVLALSKS